MKDKRLALVIIGVVVILALGACCLAGVAGAFWAYRQGIFFGSGDESTPASPEEAARTPETISEPEATTEALAPPGRAAPHPEQIAFLAWSGDQEWEFTDIYLMNIDGSGLTAITDGSTRIVSYTWAPDGERLAFQADRDGDYKYEIYVINVDGSGMARLMGGDEFSAETPAWSPDGQRIAFTQVGADYISSVALMDPDGSNVEVLTEGVTPAWSPDGLRIAYAVVDGGLFVMNVDGTGVDQLTDSSEYGYDWYPIWSPDGSQILFGSNRQTPGDAMTERLYVMNADGTSAHYFADMNWAQPPHAWSPDGSRIVFVDGFVDCTLFIMNADGADRQPLMQDNHGFFPVWRP